MRTLIAVWLFCALTAVSFAENAPHAHKHYMTPAMKKQHKAMTDTARRWAEVKASLKAGDLEKAENKVDAIMKATRDIQDFILHRNADKQEEFWKECELVQGRPEKAERRSYREECGTGKKSCCFGC